MAEKKTTKKAKGKTSAKKGKEPMVCAICGKQIAKPYAVIGTDYVCSQDCMKRCALTR